MEYQVNNKHKRKITKVKEVTVNLMCTIYFLKAGIQISFLHSCTNTKQLYYQEINLTPNGEYINSKVQTQIVHLLKRRK